MYPELQKKDAANIFELLAAAANTFNDKIFLKYEENHIVREKTFTETYEDSKKVAAWAAAAAEKLGHRLHVALLGKTGYEYLVSMFGVLGGNGVAIPLDTQLSKENMIKNLNKADTDVLFYDWSNRSEVTYIMEHCKSIKRFICLQDLKKSDTIYSILNAEPETDTLPEIDPNECALIIFTSGTTGVAKGVMLSHANEIDNTFCADEPNEPIEQYNEVLLNVLPIHHIFCFNCDFLMSMRYGSTVCLCRDLKKMMHSLLLFRPTFTRMVPMMVKALINRFAITQKQNPDLSVEEIKDMVWGKELIRIGTGGGYLAPDLAQKFLDLGMKIGQGYGMSECAPKIATPDYERPEKVGSVGRLVRGCEARIQDGELQVKSPSVMLGYYKDAELTEEIFTEDGFLCTGDLGRIDEEGFVYLTGRKKNLIIFENGENVSPEAIENTFDGEPLVADILVYGKNNKIAAEIYPNFEYAQANGIDDIISEVNSIITAHNADLPTYSQIAEVSVRKHPFEKTASKKIIREKFFKDKEEAQTKAQTLVKPQTELQQQLYELAAQVLGNDVIGIDDDLHDLGLDSMGTVMLIEDIESKLGKGITFNDLSTHRTIAQIEQLLIENEGKPQIDYTPRSEYSLTPIQNYFGYIIRGNTTGNLPFTFELHPDIDLNKLKEAIEDVIDAHPALKGMIRPSESKWLKLYRDDSKKPDIKIEKLSDMDWESRFHEMVTPFNYDGKDELYHIRLFQTETKKYMIFDVSHIMGDGITMNILLDDLNKRYMGLPVEKEKFSFYEYILDYYEKEKQGVRRRDLSYYDELLEGAQLERSILNKKDKESLQSEVNGSIKKRFDLINKKKLIYFGKKMGISENVIFYAAFNYCVGLFSDQKENITCSIHSGRTDGRYRRTAGPFFLTYLSRYSIIPHETVPELLHRTAMQIMDSMQCTISTPRQGEMFFQYQGDIINIDEVGGLPAKRLHPQLDSLPFHLQVMSDDKGYFTELRFWKNRFDREMLSNFLICYEHVVRAMLEEKSARMLKHHIPEEMYPMHFSVPAKQLNDENGTKLIKNVPDDAPVMVYVLDERYNKKPTGAWGRLYIREYEPEVILDEIAYPYQKGVSLYDTGITARILPDGRIDFLKNSGRTVLTDGSKGRRYYNLGDLEEMIKTMQKVDDCHSYLVYDDETGNMKLAMDIEVSRDSFIDRIRSATEQSFGEQLIPAVVKIISK